MNKTEVNMVVTDSLGALELYERIFDNIERVEATSLGRGLNEAVIMLNGMRIHIIDENEAYFMFAPKDGNRVSMWINVTVPDIKKTFAKALEAGCAEIFPVTRIESHGIINAMFSDKFGYLWLVHEIVREVSLEERMRAFGK
jgi:PhnB protein